MADAATLGLLVGALLVGVGVIGTAVPALPGTPLVFVGLLVSWFMLATGYAVIVRAFAFYVDRPLNWSGSWRLSAAALLPGSLFLTGTLVLYGLGLVDLIRLLAAWPLHLLVGWVYLVAAPLKLPHKVLVPVPPANPFASKKVLDEAQ